MAEVEKSYFFFLQQVIVNNIKGCTEILTVNVLIKFLHTQGGDIVVVGKGRHAIEMPSNLR